MVLLSVNSIVNLDGVMSLLYWLLLLIIVVKYYFCFMKIGLFCLNLQCNMHVPVFCLVDNGALFVSNIYLGLNLSIHNCQLFVMCRNIQYRKCRKLSNNVWTISWIMLHR